MRAFLLPALFAALWSALMLGAGTAQAQEPAGEPPIPFIDAHAHLNDEAMQLELMQAHGATQAVVFWGGRSSNDSVADAARRHPQRFIAFASVSPERSSFRPSWEQADPAALLARLDTMLASGLYRGIGEISAVHFPSPGFAEADFSLGGPMMEGILALARKHRMPVLLHVELTRLAELSALLERFADVPVIWAHGGYTPLFLARRMLERHPNLYYELSARTWSQHPRSPEYTVMPDGRLWPAWQALVEALPQRFLVGTDASGRHRETEAEKFRSVQRFLRQLSPPAREQVGRLTLLSLLGPAPTPGAPPARP